MRGQGSSHLKHARQGLPSLMFLRQHGENGQLIHPSQIIVVSLLVLQEDSFRCMLTENEVTP